MLSRAKCYKNTKVNGIINGSVTFKQCKSYFNTMSAENNCDHVPFFLLIFSIFFTIKPTNLKKNYSQISEKHGQTSTNLTNILSNLKG